MATEELIRVAVATQDRSKIDEHFGHADEFAVYDLGSEGPKFLETRIVEHYCQGGFGDEDKREVILRALADCKALFVARVGDGPRKKLLGAGIEPVDDYAHEPVEASLTAWMQARVVRADG